MGTPKAESQLLAQKGRPLGPRAVRTRNRLLETTAQLLAERSLLEITVAEIARHAKISPGTFYHYFADVEEAALALAERATLEMPDLVALFEGPWRGRDGIDTAREIASAFFDHWDAHHAALRIRNFSAERGDERFAALRRAAFAPLLLGLAERIASAQQAGRVSKSLHPIAAAAALASMLERLATYHAELEKYGVGRDDLIETCAAIMVRTLSAQSAATAL
ncbi:MAG: TetR family transcriptional regulator [Myxococcota bacterium]|jgi:AcrR family transcriptional regulator